MLLTAALAFAACGSDTTSSSDSGETKPDGGNTDTGVSPDTTVDIGGFDFSIPDQGLPPDTGASDLIVFTDTATPKPDTTPPPPDTAPPPPDVTLPVPDVQLPDGPVVDAPRPDGPVIAPDVTLTDAAASDTVLPATCGEAVGKTCTANGGECGDQALCLLTSDDGGVCTCPCVPGDPANGCPDATTQVCGTVPLSDGSAQGFCFQSCQPKLGANDCQAPLACSPRSAAFSDALDHAVCIFTGCTTDDQCPVTTGTTCDTQTGGCGTDEQCIALSATSSAGICVKAGTCDTQSGLCGGKPAGMFKAGAKIGDGCGSDLDCDQFQSCEGQIDPKALLGQKDHGAVCTQDAECCGGCNATTSTCEGTCAVHARNGYCVSGGCVFATATDYKEYGCPAGSTCNRLFTGGLCMKSCDLANAADCRGNSSDVYGDYECRAWNNITTFSGGTLVDTPVCDFGDLLPCNFLGTNYTCADLGDQTNSTQMTCRTLDGQPTADPADPKGFCFDNTSSGAQPTGLLQYGDVCTLASPTCAPGLTCVPLSQGATDGVCTEPCTNTGEACAGTPADTLAGCIWSYQGTSYCAFICKIGSPEQTFNCPSTMTCAAAPNPAGSTQFICEIP